MGTLKVGAKMVAITRKKDIIGNIIDRIIPGLRKKGLNPTVTTEHGRKFVNVKNNGVLAKVEVKTGTYPPAAVSYLSRPPKLPATK